MDNIEQLRKVATRAGKLLTSLSENIRQQKEESVSYTHLTLPTILLV